jgi:hypothetical protein
MRTGRPTAELKLAAHEQEALENWARRPKSAQALALRAHNPALRNAQDEHGSGCRTARYQAGVSANHLHIQVASPPRRWKGLIRLASVSSSAFRK